jgi:hypothetical protein
MQSLFLYPCPSGERVVAVRHDWMNAASAMMCVLKAWELSPHLLETTVLPLELEALAILQPVLVLGGGEMDVTARNINWIKMPRTSPHFQYSKSISRYSKSNSGYSESNGQTAKIYRTGRVPCIAKHIVK